MIRMIVLIAALGAICLSGNASGESVVYSLGVIDPGTVVGDRNRDSSCNHDGSFEDAFAFQYEGIAPPYYGAFAESYDFTGMEVYITGVCLWFTQSGGYSGGPIDIYLWNDDACNPGSVLAVKTGIDPGPPAYWEEVSEHCIEFDTPILVNERVWVGYWPDWPDEAGQFYIGSDLYGPGSLCGPRVNIPPGLGYPEGWQNPSIVGHETAAFGICVLYEDELPGACCFADGSCQVLGQQNCVQTGGQFYAEYDSCDPNPCPQATRWYFQDYGTPGVWDADWMPYDVGQICFDPLEPGECMNERYPPGPGPGGRVRWGADVCNLTVHYGPNCLTGHMPADSSYYVLDLWLDHLSGTYYFFHAELWRGPCDPLCGPSTTVTSFSTWSILPGLNHYRLQSDPNMPPVPLDLENERLWLEFQTYDDVYDLCWGADTLCYLQCPGVYQPGSWPYGACCHEDGACTYVRDYDCPTLDWRAGEECDPNPCPVAMDFTVCPDGSADFLTIQEAIDAAGSGSVITLCNDTFTGPQNRHLDYSGKAITIVSESGDPDLCIIDCQGQDLGFYFHSGEGSTSVLEGVTIANGYNPNRGGGILCANASSPTIINCKFSGNSAWSGGGLYCLDGACPEVTGCTFSGNSATDYGGGVTCNLGGPILTGCTFSGNSSGLYGGGIACSGNPSPTLISCTFSDNSAPHGGGISASLSSSPTIEKCIIALSTSGEGVYCYDGGSASLTCCDVFGNAGGDWVGCIADQYGVDNNFLANPFFCDPNNEDFTLAENSACLPGHSPCGEQIGAFGQGCGPVPLVTVCPDGSGDYLTIQLPIDAAVGGETIELCDATFTGPGNRDIDYLGKAVTVRSQSGNPEACIIDCEAQGRGFFIHSGEDSSSVLEGVTIRNARFGVRGGGMACKNSSSPRITNCRFSGNSASVGGGIYCTNYAFPEVTNCTFSGNLATAGDGGGICCEVGANPRLIYCTFSGNSATGSGGGIAVFTSSSPTIENSIIAFSTSGEGIYCDGESNATLTCSDVYGNAGGDWTGCIADQAGINGNISEDPMFCDAATEDFHVAMESPCVDTEGCGQIGAFGPGSCGMQITSITDVGNDQGRQVRTQWDRAWHDTEGTEYAITSYSLWRRVDENFRGNGSNEAQIAHAMLRHPPGDWDYIRDVPAMQQDSYSTICPTLCDSTIANGMCWSVFFVAAHTEDPEIWFECVPDSGYSVDNLAPEAPAGLRWTYPALLAWDESEDADFNYFAVYGSENEEFDENAVFIGYTTETDLDLSAEQDFYAYYFVTATDFSGNEGAPASLQIPADIDGSEPLPLTYALRPSTPNPFTGRTTLSFDLPEPSATRFTVYDAAGRLVRTLIDRTLPAGRHQFIWDARGENGKHVPPGIYFARLRASRFGATERLVILR